jgi:hypothetical protein
MLMNMGLGQLDSLLKRKQLDLAFDDEFDRRVARGRYH